MRVKLYLIVKTSEIFMVLVLHRQQLPVFTAGNFICSLSLKPVSTIYTRVGCLSKIFYFILIYFI